MIDGLNIVVKMYFGSQLYGTATKNSDTDIKGVFMPTREQILLSRIPKCYSHKTKSGNDAKNTADDVDVEIYSLHYFLDLACAGETVALDMLHAPGEMVLDGSHTWASLLDNRDKFYTRNLKAFIGYARRQAAKYGIKGSRLNDARRVVSFLGSQDSDAKLREVWGFLPTGDHIHFREENANGLKEYQVCGKTFQETAKVGYVLPIISKFVDQYGKRAEQAARNEGIDWKAVSHALRAAFQVKEILTENQITFPLKQADYLLDVKLGKYDYLTVVAPRLDELMDEVEELSQKSTLPMKADRNFWDQWLINAIKYEWSCNGVPRR